MLAEIVKFLEEQKSSTFPEWVQKVQTVVVVFVHLYCLFFPIELFHQNDRG